MRILATLIAVFMVSGAVAQDYDANDVQFSQQKKLGGAQAPVNVTCDQGFIAGGNVRDATAWSCKDPKTGKTQKVQCKKPPKQKIPDKVTLAELDEACSLRSDNRF